MARQDTSMKYQSIFNLMAVKFLHTNRLQSRSQDFECVDASDHPERRTTRAPEARVDRNFCAVFQSKLQFKFWFVSDCSSGWSTWFKLHFHSTPASLVINSRLSHRSRIGGPRRWTSAARVCVCVCVCVCVWREGGGDADAPVASPLPTGLDSELELPCTEVVIILEHCKDILDVNGGLKDALSELTNRDKSEKDEEYEVKIEAL